MNPAPLHQAAAVHYTVDILDAASGRIVRRLPRKKNLILDQGLDGIAVRSWAGSFLYAAAGTGTTPVKRDSGAITFSRAGNVVSASAGFFEAADVGRLLKWDAGQEVRIIGFTDAQTVTTSTSGTIAAGEGTVWYVNQTALVTETKRTNTYSADGGANGSTYSAGTYTHKRTFLFAAESGTVTYREIGWSHTTGPGNLFGRDLLPGAGVTLVATQILRVVVELTVAYSPVTSTAYASIATGGWTQNGTCGIEEIGAANVAVVASNGTVGASGGLDPSGSAAICVSTSSAAIVAATTGQIIIAGVLADIGANLLAYTPGSFSRVKSLTFTVSQANSSAIRSLAIGVNKDHSGFRVLLNASETKTSSQTLTLGFAFAWGRVLSNA